MGIFDHVCMYAASEYLLAQKTRWREDEPCVLGEKSSYADEESDYTPVLY